ncbi:chitinase-3-like protein 1 [Ixodes scapularis]|uniref:chitinase-3-like protein 1 n=1 Tax=Ixodes scapularis TaxID=6945 RepID=UPI001C380202|nr:chitinase-3-like protein 1 [Ixodes scapularis]
MKSACALIAFLSAVLVESQSSKCSRVQTTNPPREKLFLCYWGAWSYYREGDGKFSVEHIDPFLCTHLVYTFAILENDLITAYDPYLDLTDNWGLGMYKKFNDLKRRNRDLKTIIAIGGWNEGSEKYSNMSKTAEGRKRFVDSVLEFLDRHGFDGLDLNWEYPSRRGGYPEDRENHALLLKELRAALDQKNRMLIASVSMGIETVNVSYNVPEVMKSVHLLNVMGYDFFGAWENYTGHNSPLRARKGGNELEQTFNVETGLQFWIDKGANVSKMVLGLPLYGRTFTLDDPKNSGYLALATQPGQAGNHTKFAGYLGYNEICVLRRPGGWKETRDPDVGAPVIVKGDQWIGYDDVESLKKKVAFALSKGLAGAMVWSIETDDFRGHCGDTKNPLQSAIKEALCLTPVPPDPCVSGRRCVPCDPDDFGGDCGRTENPLQSAIKETQRPTPVPPNPCVPSGRCVPDDFGGECGRTKNPLQSAIKKTQRPTPVPHDPCVSGGRCVPGVPPLTTKAPVVTRPSRKVTLPTQMVTRPTPRMTQPFECTKSGIFAHPKSDKMYIQCVLRYDAYQRPCPPGTTFSPEERRCIHEAKSKRARGL